MIEYPYELSTEACYCIDDAGAPLDECENADCFIMRMDLVSEHLRPWVVDNDTNLMELRSWPGPYGTCLPSAGFAQVDLPEELLCGIFLNTGPAFEMKYAEPDGDVLRIWLKYWVDSESGPVEGEIQIVRNVPEEACRE